ncbi:uncharacterized protein LOC111715720 isoform X2 [Eurytemora carolleeae]|uniref:uncharacterized protein LOC111715720 isoform X2 n=1 Tax=Eurytemora carolleeae TaxID=1294199 RepID=UPI000C788B83|nr:uncharacterized protein LOC111715720 isoform X2 [Eurytemora carolleeae]|eukprot:XP_023346854.1 uncharacterized protein LOC111715720 isoform X2 [Eurytemora affinis]
MTGTSSIYDQTSSENAWGFLSAILFNPIKRIRQLSLFYGARVTVTPLQDDYYEISIRPLLFVYIMSWFFTICSFVSGKLVIAGKLLAGMVLSLIHFVSSVLVWISTPISSLKIELKLDEPVIITGLDGQLAVLTVTKSGQRYDIEVIGKEDETANLQATLQVEENGVELTANTKEDIDSMVRLTYSKQQKQEENNNTKKSN